MSLGCKKKHLSVMVRAKISDSGGTSLVFVPSGIKINASTYSDLILEPVVKNLGQTVFDKSSFVFQQDGAPAPIPQIALKIGFAAIISRGLSVKINGLPTAQT